MKRQNWVNNVPKYAWGANVAKKRRKKSTTRSLSKRGSRSKGFRTRLRSSARRLLTYFWLDKRWRHNFRSCKSRVMHVGRVRQRQGTGEGEEHVSGEPTLLACTSPQKKKVSQLMILREACVCWSAQRNRLRQFDSSCGEWKKQRQVKMYKQEQRAKTDGGG